MEADGSRGGRRHHRLVRNRSSGGGFVAVGDQTATAPGDRTAARTTQPLRCGFFGAPLREGAPASLRRPISLPEIRVAASASSVPGGSSAGQLDEGEVRADRDVCRSPCGSGRPRWPARRRSGAARPCAACRRRCGTSPSAGRPGCGARASRRCRGEGRSVPRSGRSWRSWRGGPDRLGVEQQRGVALEHDGQGGGDVDLGHVVLADVVRDDVAEEGDPLGRGERLGDGVVEARQPGDVHVVDRGQLHLRQRLAGGLLDRLEQVALARA